MEISVEIEVQMTDYVHVFPSVCWRRGGTLLQPQVAQPPHVIRTELLLPDAGALKHDLER